MAFAIPACLREIMAFGLFRNRVPEVAAFVLEAKAPQQAAAGAAACAEADSARDILELLDLELSGPIRRFERAAVSVAGGSEATAATLATIRDRTDALTGRSSAAQGIATAFAQGSDKSIRSAEGHVNYDG